MTSTSGHVGGVVGDVVVVVSGSVSVESIVIALFYQQQGFTNANNYLV